MNENEIKEIKELLSTPKNIVLVAHKNPDGDAIGSTLGMQHYLKQKGHKATTVLPNDVPEFLHWLPGVETVYKYDKQNKQSKRSLDEADIVFVLDFNAFHRVGDDMQKALEEYKGTYIMIDHHQQPDPISKYIYSDTSICSTCQMVYHFIDKMGDLNFINPEVATCLYTGIMTDTGSFRFPSTTSTTHKIIGELIDKGADNAKIHDNVFNASSYSRLQLMGAALTNLIVLPEYHTAYITLSQEELDKYNYQKGDTEGLVNYGLSMKGIYLAAIFIEDVEQGIIKISFRSKGSFSVNQFSRNHFNGGGHDNAAGGRSLISLEATVEEFLNQLKGYKNELAVSYEN
ncbi:bifunctional oligoribonuclease/PAP phosphatase NrnA [Flavicella sp.]|uniref:DHH family phosphoesterase n=1 Tax=Flavicella sp. TaxID=2957742 RepID=UPI0026212A99|nr:bifunctional oligoribonuclease/PAP phosphatase NrnA [Flavicella sp.]MDG1803770.1 bifunctional oligoribonuclease/PAP phosphatase NrnA [Flavicella sp.]